MVDGENGSREKSPTSCAIKIEQYTIADTYKRQGPSDNPSAP